MKRTIRRGCFETNSSSMHSIVVTKDDHIFNKEELSYHFKEYNDYEIWQDDDLNFGRYPFEILSDLEDKIRYAIASYCSYKSRKYCEAFISKLTDIIREELPDFKKIIVPHNSGPVFLDIHGQELEKDEVHWDRYETDEESGKEESVYVYTDEQGNKHDATRADYWKDYDYFGYVDHQSSGLLQGFLEKENITLKEFLFNKKYIVIIDGDEYCMFDKAKESGLINMSNIQKEFPDPNGEYGSIPYDSIETFNKLSNLE